LPDLTGIADKHTLELPQLGLMRVAEYHTPTLDVQIAMSLRNFERVNATFRSVFLLGIPLLAFLSVVFGMTLQHFTLRPIRLMQAAARRITANNLNERIPIPPRGGEMTALAKLINEMMDRLEKSFTQVKRFTADTSHELMTPLAVIRLHSERLLNDPELPAKFRHAVEEQMHETIYLTETLERLLTLAKADSSVLPLKLQVCQTSEYINQFTEDAKLLAESRGLKLVVSQNDSGTVAFDHGWIRQVMFNLMSNAVRHSPPCGTITIYSKCDHAWWTLEIWDEGTGVPAGQLEDIFERFVQITPRSSHGTGAGLGLAICKSIIELHRGRIFARLRTDRSGLIIQCALPLNETPGEA
jgi:signal transduction histidine kinase